MTVDPETLMTLAAVDKVLAALIGWERVDPRTVNPLLDRRIELSALPDLEEES